MFLYGISTVYVYSDVPAFRLLTVAYSRTRLTYYCYEHPLLVGHLRCQITCHWVLP